MQNKQMEVIDVGKEMVIDGLKFKVLTFSDGKTAKLYSQYKAKDDNGEYTILTDRKNYHDIKTGTYEISLYKDTVQFIKLVKVQGSTPKQPENASNTPSSANSGHSGDDTQVQIARSTALYNAVECLKSGENGVKSPDSVIGLANRFTNWIINGGKNDDIPF